MTSPDPQGAAVADVDTQPTQSQAQPKKKRGRPRKNPVDDSKLDPVPVANLPKDEKPFASVIKATGSIAIDPTAGADVPTFPVFMGVKDGCPYANIQAGGKEFSHHTEIVEADSSGITNRTKQRGKVTDLTRAEIENVAAAVGRKVLRMRGHSPLILDVGNPHYRPHNEDEPLGKSLYMQIMTDRMPHDWRERDPEVMA